MCTVQKWIQICWQLLFSLDNAHCVNVGIYNKKQPPFEGQDLSIRLSAAFAWFCNFACAKGLLVLLSVSWYWYFGSVLLAWGHGMGMACPSDYQALFVHFLHQGMCPMLHYFTFTVHRITFLTPRHVPYAAPSAFGTRRLPPWLLVSLDQMPWDLSGPFVTQPNLCVWLY